MSSRKAVSLEGYVIRRALQLLPIVLFVILVNFTLIHLAPGDPASLLAGGEAGAAPEFIEKTRKKFGLDKPWLEQLLIYVSSVLQGDLGYSWHYRMPVLDLLLQRMVNTLILMGTALVFSVLLSILLGVLASRKPYSLADNSISISSLVAYSTPSFWMGMMLILVFAVNLNLFPSQGMTSLWKATFWEHVRDVLHHMVLPVVTLGIRNLALYTRLTRASLLEVLSMDFVTTARAKGLSERTVIYRHALKNALLPLITVTGMNIGAMMVGALLTETVFSWPGLGSLLYDSILARDYPVILGQMVIVATMIIIANLITDIVYAFIDPRIRY